MSVVGQGLRLIRIGSGGIMHKSLFRAFDPHSPIKFFGHGVQLHHRDCFAHGYFSHGIRIIGVGVDHLACGIKRPSGSRSDKHHVQPGFTRLVNEYFQVCGEVIISTSAGTSLLLVVVAEFNHQPIARLSHRQHFVKTFFGNKGCCTLSAFSII